MSGANDGFREIIHRHLDALKSTSACRPGELFTEVMEAVRNICLELNDLGLAGDPGLARRLLAAANQMVLGLLFHLAGNGACRAELRELQERVEEQLRQVQAEREQVDQLKYRLRVLDADLAILCQEREMLEAIAAYDQLRERLGAKHNARRAYHRLLADAASRARHKRDQLDELSRQMEDLLERQRQLLGDELEIEERAWQAVEGEVFGS